MKKEVQNKGKQHSAKKEQKELANGTVEIPVVYEPKRVPIEVIKGKKTTFVELDEKIPDLTVGLSSDEVATRVKLGLNNKVSKSGSKTILSIFVTNIFTVFNLLNFAIGGWLFSVNLPQNCFFLVIVSANIVIGIIQEIRAKITIDKLSLLSAPTGRVLRNSVQEDISIENIVIDDIMLLSSGKQICSDSVVCEGVIEVNESLLTGESDAILKKPGDTLYSGSFVVSGNCKVQVTAVGNSNYIEKLAGEARKYVRPRSDLFNSLKLIIRTVGCLIAILGPLNFYLDHFVYGTDPVDAGYVDAVRATTGAVIGMIPSGLFLLSSIALAVGVIRLAQNKTLVQELYCIEMLARVNCLCLDKTGTITDGTMTVRGLVEYQNDSGLTVTQIVSGIINALGDNNLTSQALEQKFGRGSRYKTVATIPFSSSRKFSAVEFEKTGTFLLGAPEFILTDSYDTISYDVERNATQGYRVILIAKANGPIINNEVTGKITPISLVLIEDTIRPEAITTIDYFKTNGVSVRVISGDNPLTVSKVSERAGIENANKYISLDGLSDGEVAAAAMNYTVFGRVSPTQKRILVRTLKSNGLTVAMTGDGVNDILALKESDCSIAMASGSEAARNVSHLVLLDSNFASMPKVVNEGRRVINNVQRVASLFLTKTIFSTLLLLSVVCMMGLFGIERSYPIDTKQLMMIDFLVIGLPSFVLALEPNNNVVCGKFIKNVFKNALPGALVVVFNTYLVYGLTEMMGISVMDSTTIIVLATTFVCMTVLFNVCRPFNWLRAFLFFVMFTTFICLLSFIPEFFTIESIYSWLNTEDISKFFLLMMMVLWSPLLMKIFRDGHIWVKKGFIEIKKFFSGSKRHHD